MGYRYDDEDEAMLGLSPRGAYSGHAYLQAMLREIKPMRLMWWTNPTYWSTQGPVWAEAKRSPDSGVGKWFSWGPEDCEGVSTCSGRNVVVPGVGASERSRTFLRIHHHPPLSGWFEITYLSRPAYPPRRLHFS